MRVIPLTNILYYGFTLICIMSLIGCRTKEDFVKNPSDTIANPPSLDEYYYLPSPSEYILNVLPRIIEENQDELIEELLYNPDINLKEEVYEYFEQKSKKAIGEIFQMLP